MNASLDFIMIGAQKCATSWVYYCLRDHPEICLPQKKREVEYIGGDRYQKRGTAWFKSLLDHCEANRVVGDVSVDYLIDPRSPKAVERHTSEVKLIVSLREPVDRAVSAYFWNLRRGSVQDLDVSVGLNRAVQAWLDAPGLDGYDPNACVRNLIARGMYAEQLRRYADRFGRRDLFVIFYDDLRKRPLDLLQKLYGFLDVDPAFKPVSLSRQPKRNSYARPLLRFERSTPDWVLFNKLSDVANQMLCKFELGKERPGLAPEVARELYELYRSPNDDLRRFVAQLPESNVSSSLSGRLLWPSPRS